PDVSAVVAFAPPAAPWLVACDAAICCNREIVDDSVARLFLGGANDGSAVAGLRKALDASVPGVPIRTCQRRTPVVVRVANIDEEAAFHVPQVELRPELTGADFARLLHTRSSRFVSGNSHGDGECEGEPSLTRMQWSRSADSHAWVNILYPNNFSSDTVRQYRKLRRRPKPARQSSIPPKSP